MSKYLKVSVLILVMISFIAVPIFADDFKDLKDTIEDILKNESASSYDKANLVRKLAAYPTADTVEFCFKIIKFKDKNAKKIEKEMAQLEKEIEDLKKQVEDMNARFRANGNRGSVEDINTRNGWLKEIDGKEKQILELEDKLNSMSAAKSAVIHVFSKMDTSEARSAMLEGLDDRDWRIVYATIEGFGKQGWDGAFEKIAQHYPVDDKPHKSDLVRKATIVALRAIDQKRAMKNLITALNDENIIIRRQAVIGLGEIAENDCIMPLIDQIEKEEGRLKSDIITILSNLTGKGFGDNVKEWKSWWRANKDDFELIKVDDVMKKAARDEGSHKTDTFYGVEVDTNHPIFIIDQSGSMISAADENVARKQIEAWMKANPGQNMIPPIPPPAGHMSKWEVLQQELKKVIMNLSNKKADFNIVWYSTNVEVYNKEGMVEADVKAKDKAAKEIDRRQADGMTNIYEALETAFMLATGKTKKGESEWTGKGESELKADTFFFMTDGSPTEGPVTDPQQILEKVHEWNRTPKIKIHTIGVGLCAKEFLAALAKDNNGTFTLHNTEPDKKKK